MLSATCTAATMSGRHPQDSNIIDFIQVKLLAMVEEYSSAGMIPMADALWSALDQYMAGDIDIIFKHGQPYVIAREIDGITDE